MARKRQKLYHQRLKEAGVAKIVTRAGKVDHEEYQRNLREYNRQKNKRESRSRKSDKDRKQARTKTYMDMFDTSDIDSVPTSQTASDDSDPEHSIFGTHQAKRQAMRRVHGLPQDANKWAYVMANIIASASETKKNCSSKKLSGYR